jgi:Zn-dependent peptidase ImmA (M78 family)/transcriptional regulator with XRE-family HTH domain
MANLVPVNPDIITWARSYHNLTLEELADKTKIHVNQIAKWEAGETKPTLTQARKLASVLRLPFAYLFLSERPTLETPLPDLRTRHAHTTVSPNFREILYRTFDRYDWYKEYLQENDALDPLPFVGSFTTSDDPLLVAADIRKTLAITPAMRHAVAPWIGYLKALCSNAEDVGILVMRSSEVRPGTRQKLLPDEFQGFVITDKFAPVVFVNSRDYVGAQIFTLAHELAHIWIGQSGIVDPDEAEVPEPKKDSESFCNAVAADVLVPKAEFISAWEKHLHSTAALVKEFKVSEIVLLRRAFELNLINRNEFFPRLQQLKEDVAEAKRGFGRSTHPDRIATQHSTRFMDAVIQDTRIGGTLFRDGARLLSMTLPTFMRVVEGK